MVYSFLYEFNKYPINVRKDLLKNISNIQLQILEHIYLNKNIFNAEELRTYIYTFEPNSTDIKLKNILTLFKNTNYKTEDIAQMILNYLNSVALIYGQKEANRASKVIFAKKRIIGIKAKDVICEIERRKAKK